MSFIFLCCSSNILAEPFGSFDWKNNFAPSSIVSLHCSCKHNAHLFNSLIINSHSLNNFGCSFLISSNIKETASALVFDFELCKTVKGYVRERGFFNPIFFKSNIKVFLIKGFVTLILASNCGITKSQLSIEIISIFSFINLSIYSSFPIWNQMLIKSNKSCNIFEILLPPIHILLVKPSIAFIA